MKEAAPPGPLWPLWFRLRMSGEIRVSGAVHRQTRADTFAGRFGPGKGLAIATQTRPRAFTTKKPKN